MNKLSACKKYYNSYVCTKTILSGSGRGQVRMSLMIVNDSYDHNSIRKNGRKNESNDRERL